MSRVESRRRRGHRLAMVACVAWCLAGCGRATGPATYPVSGTVTLDGKPLSKGNVIFYPEAENMPAVMGKLADGRYSFPAVAGRQRVAIQAVADKPREVGKGLPPVFESIVPSRYNESTTLSADVSPEGPNRFDFDLTSGRRSDQ